jgi:hypothetical protein
VLQISFSDTEICFWNHIKIKAKVEKSQLSLCRFQVYVDIKFITLGYTSQKKQKHNNHKINIFCTTYVSGKYRLLMTYTYCFCVNPNQVFPVEVLSTMFDLTPSTRLTNDKLWNKYIIKKKTKTEFKTIYLSLTQ